MRRLLALGCGLAYLAFGVMAGAAHVHEAADHHDELRGLHLNHTHVGDARHDSTGDHHHGLPDDGQFQLGDRHVDHHEGDALYLTMTVRRSLGSGPPVMPAIIAVVTTFDPPILVSTSRIELSDQLRGPPQTRVTPSRAPPA